MSAFEDRYKSLFEFASVIGWDGYSANAVSPKVKERARYVYEYYNLYGKPHDLVLNTTGTVNFEVDCIHGWLDIHVGEDDFVAGIVTDDDKVIMPDIVRTYPDSISAFP